MAYSDRLRLSTARPLWKSATWDGPMASKLRAVPELVEYGGRNPILSGHTWSWENYPDVNRDQPPYHDI